MVFDRCPYVVSPTKVHQRKFCIAKQRSLISAQDLKIAVLPKSVGGRKWNRVTNIKGGRI